MQSPAYSPLPVSLSVRIYGLLLMAYPSGFRRAYGPDMLQVFADCCRAAYRRAGAGGLPGLWARTMLDYLRTVFEEHIQRGVSMSRETLIKISGWSLVVGPIAVLLGWLASTRPEYSLYNAASWPIDKFLNGSVFILFTIGMALSSLGVFGLLARYGARSGRFGQASLLAAAFGGMASTAGSVVMSVVDSEFWWVVFYFGTMLFFLGLVLFAIGCLLRGLFPRLAGLLLGVSIWVPAYMLVGTVYENATGNWLELPGLISGILLSVSFLGISLVGYQLQRSAAGEEQALQTA